MEEFEVSESAKKTKGIYISTVFGIAMVLLMVGLLGLILVHAHKLSRYVKEMLLDERTLSRPYWTRRYVEKVVGDHLRGVGNYTLEIHQMLTCELIQRQLIERK